MNIEFFRSGFARVGFVPKRLTRTADTNDWLTEWSRREARKAIDDIHREAEWKQTKVALRRLVMKLLTWLRAAQQRSWSIASRVRAAISYLCFALMRKSSAVTAAIFRRDSSGGSSS
jgi:hypothetical protein